MCHENDLMHFYKKDFIKYNVEKLATEYLKIEKEIEKNMQMQKNDYIDLPEYDEIVLAKPK